MPLHVESTQNVHVAITEGRAALHVEHETSPAREALERWRSSRAKLSGIDKKLVMSDKTLEAIIDLHPTSRIELAAIEGLGPVRAANIGDELLELLTTNE